MLSQKIAFQKVEFQFSHHSAIQLLYLQNVLRKELKILVLGRNDTNILPLFLMLSAVLKFFLRTKMFNKC